MLSVSGVRPYRCGANCIAASTPYKNNNLSFKGSISFTSNEDTFEKKEPPKRSYPYADYWKGPYRPSGYECYFIDDMFLKDNLRPESYTEAIAPLAYYNKLDDLVYVCNHAKNYYRYDGGGYYTIDNYNDAPKIARNELLNLGRVNEAALFMRMCMNDRYKTSTEKSDNELLDDCDLSLSDSTIYGLKSQREALSGMDPDEKKKYLEELEAKIDKAKVLEGKKEEVREQLRPFISRLASFYCGKPARFPNCIMLVTDNNFIVPDTMNWLEKNAENTDFRYVKADLDNDVLQNNMIDELDEAEIRYQTTGRRSVIFVEHLDRLISRVTNTPENIASMKEYMNTADEDYHSTIVFQARPQLIKTLDPGTIKSNRVGLRVDIPITIKDMDLLHVKSEEK